MIIRLGVITRVVSGEGIYVRLPDLDPVYEWGPLEAVNAGAGAYAPGKRVLIGNVGSISDAYIVIGPIMETY